MLIGILIGVSTTAGNGGTSGPTNAILAENGNFLVTESGNYLVKES